MRVMAALSVLASAVLAAAAVWMGALNQDEGWYVYAAQLVAEGLLPYRDFFFTQAPVMPIVYSAFDCVWEAFGLLGARVLTLGFGLFSIVFAVGIALNLAPEGKKGYAAVVAFLLLGCNLYHLYYLAIPKTYALAGLFAALGFYLLTFPRRHWALAFAAGSALAIAAGTRISLGILLAVGGVWLLVGGRRKEAVAFAVAGALVLAGIYGPFLFDDAARNGLLAAQSYHAARGGADIVWTVGSLSRLVRWYLPLFVTAGIAVAFSSRERRMAVLPPFAGFAAVLAVQMLAPFPYEDYQVPVMGLFAASAAALFAGSGAFTSRNAGRLLVLGMAFAAAFGSPLLQQWTTNQQDRFWSRKKTATELSQLRKTAAAIEKLDPGGKMLFTQDLYLAVETGRKVPRGLEMGPFAMMTDEKWKALIASAPCRIAAMSGYTFAIEPPECGERPIGRQLEYWELLRRRYRLVDKVEDFGQNATTLLILERK